MGIDLDKLLTKASTTLIRRTTWRIGFIEAASAGDILGKLTALPTNATLTDVQCMDGVVTMFFQQERDVVEPQ